MTPVTPNEIARRLGVTGLQFRNWLRGKWRAGDPRLADHTINGRWFFPPDLAEALEREYRAEPNTSESARTRPHGSTSPAGRSSASSKRKPGPRIRASTTDISDAGHRVTVIWHGKQVETLADLLRPNLTAVVVGINPAPPSVAAGHYWQGRTGQTLWRRLKRVGLLPAAAVGYEDNAAFAAGVGFTDVVKRPSSRAADVTEPELETGRRILEEKLTKLQVPLVIFAFKKAATTLLGPFESNGFLDHRKRIGVSQIFVMPGPYEPAATAGPTLDTLTEWVDTRRKLRRPTD